uniref:Uncharacterized protein n=1 Tax=viral metagenome TaxID=1070528 RepID=A0A6M3L2S5_9ZZZZ
MDKMEQLSLFRENSKNTENIFPNDNFVISQGENGLVAYGIQIDPLVKQGMKTLILTTKSFALYNKAMTVEEVNNVIKSMRQTETMRWNS